MITEFAELVGLLRHYRQEKGHREVSYEATPSQSKSLITNPECDIEAIDGLAADIGIIMISDIGQRLLLWHILGVLRFRRVWVQ